MSTGTSHALPFFTPNSLVLPNAEAVRNDLFDRFIALIRRFPPSDICASKTSRAWLMYLYTQGHLPLVCIPKIDSFFPEHRDILTRHASMTNDTHSRLALSLGTLGTLSVLLRNDGLIGVRGLDQVPSAIQECTHRWVVFFLAIRKEGQRVGHSNILLVDKRTRTYERFEPHGVISSYTKRLGDTLWHSKRFRKALAGYLPVPDHFVCPYIGPQTHDRNASSAYFKQHCPEGGGFCALYSMMWLHLRLSLDTVDPQASLHFWQRLTGEELFDLARRYHTWMRVSSQRGLTQTEMLTYLNETPDSLTSWLDSLIRP